MITRFRGIATAFAIFAVMPSRAFGAEVPLTLPEALSRAEAASALVVRARSGRSVVESRRVGAGILMPANPVVAGSGGGLFVGDVSDQGQVFPGGTGAQWAVRLEQAVEIGGQRGTRLDEVSAAMRTAEARENVAIVETRARVRIAYLAALLAGDLVEAERLRENIAVQLVDSVKTRVEAGAGNDVELTLAQAEYGRTATARLQAELERETRLADLRVLVGVKASDSLRLTTPLSAPEGEVPALEALVKAAIQRRVDLQSLKAEASEFDATIVRLRRERIPSPTFFVDVASQTLIGTNPAQTYVGGGLALPLPVFRRNQGEIAIARAERGRLDAEAALSERLIAEEVAVARHEMLRRREQLELFNKTIVPAAARQAELVREGWRAGKFDLFRVIAAVREETSARREQLAALGALWQAAITLDRATGAL